MFADEYNLTLQAVIGDLNRSQVIDDPDALLWLDEPVDVNGDEAVDSADLQYILDRI